MFGQAQRLGDMVTAIVDGGFLDSLDDSGIAAMARGISALCTFREFTEAGERFFRVRFADGSDIVFARENTDQHLPSDPLRIAMPLRD